MPKFEFPSDKLDITNERAHTFIEKCEEYVDSMDEILSIFDVTYVYHVLCLATFSYIFITFILIIIFRKDYKSLNSSFRLTLFFSAGGLINIANSYFVQINYTKYPCFLMFFCTGISYPLLIIPCMGYILNYLKQCYYSNYAYDKIANDESAISSNFSEPTKSTTEKVTTHKLLNKFNFYISAKFITKILFTYLAIIIIYSVIIGFISKDYSIFPLEQGFCTLTVEYAPQLFLIFFFFLIFLPFSVYELCKLNDSINMKTSLMFTTIFMFISLLGYFIMSLLPSYNCSQTSRYWPSDTFVLLLCISYHYTQIATPLINIFYLKAKAKKLVVSKQGLVKLLHDRILFSEFAEECKRGRCVENILFYIEYKKYKSLINNKYHKSSIVLNEDDTGKNRFNIRASSIQDVERPKGDLSEDFVKINIDETKEGKVGDDSSTDLYNKSEEKQQERSGRINSIFQDKKLAVFSNLKEAASNAHMKWSNTNMKHSTTTEEIINRMNYVFSKFIKPFSDYELNLTAKTIKKITEFVNSVNKMNKSHETINITSDFESIFDDAFNEVIDTLYLNVYMQYVVKKQNKKNNKGNNAKKDNSNKDNNIKV